MTFHRHIVSGRAGLRPALVLLAVIFFGATLTAAEEPVAPQPAGELGTYAAVGSGVARSVGIADLNWTDAQLEAFIQGLRAAHAKQPYAFDDSARQLFDDLQKRVAKAKTSEPAASPAKQAAALDEELLQQLRFVRESLAMQQTDSGLLYRIIRGGAGPRPRPHDTVIVNFSATTPASQKELPQLSGRGMRMKVDELPAGVIEGLQMLALGGTGLFFLAPHLSFGDGPWPEGIPAGSPIMLQIELVDIVSADPAK